MAKNRHFYGFFARFRAIFGVLQRTLTPSFVADAIAPAANNRYSVPYESSYPSQFESCYQIMIVILFFITILL